MKKFRICVTGLLAAGLLLTACGKSASFDVSSLGQDLKDNITYQDDLMLMDTDTASMFLNLSDIDIVNSAIYEGSGATAEEIVVLECSSAEEAAKAESMLKDRVNEQKESYADYAPDEVKKLDAAIISVNGNYACLSVSDDSDSAKKIISKYM